MYYAFSILASVIGPQLYQQMPVNTSTGRAFDEVLADYGIPGEGDSWCSAVVGECQKLIDLEIRKHDGLQVDEALLMAELGPALDYLGQMLGPWWGTPAAVGQGYELLQRLLTIVLSGTGHINRFYGLLGRVPMPRTMLMRALRAAGWSSKPYALPWASEWSNQGAPRRNRERPTGVRAEKASASQRSPTMPMGGGVGDLGSGLNLVRGLSNGSSHYTAPTAGGPLGVRSVHPPWAGQLGP